MQIRPATRTDLDPMWAIFQAVVAAGDALPFSEEFRRETFEAHWFGDQAAYVALAPAGVVGMYKLGANYPGRGDHVASATYLVHPAAQGRGIGRALVQHSLAQARKEGFAAMQFNYVVSSNTAAVELYKRLGFAIAGTLPKAFRHGQLGLVDAYVMHRCLAEESQRGGTDKLEAVTRALAAREPIFHRPEFGATREDFDRMMAEDFWEVGASGSRYSREFVLDTLERLRGESAPEHLVVTDFACRQLGADTYLVTYQLEQDGGRRSRRATLWRESPQGWKILYHQGTPIAAS